MRISFRPSGGRGEYELAGGHDQTESSSLRHRRIYLEFRPDVVLDTASIVTVVNGKPRVRLLPDGVAHPSRLLAWVLLMPAPRREIGRVGSGVEVLRSTEFYIADIGVQLVSTNDTAVVLRPTVIRCANKTTDVLVSARDRFDSVAMLWGAAHIKQDHTRSDSIIAHESAVRASDVGKLKRMFTSLTDKHEDDRLPNLLMEYGLSPVVDDEEQGLVVPKDEDGSSVLEANRSEVRRLRMVVDRGPDARTFAEQVKNAYNFTCAFSGLRLPRTDRIGVPGVDAAHIVPWSESGANQVTNGLCLNKLAHWAFDNGVLRLDYSDVAGEYVVSCPDFDASIPSPPGPPVSYDYFQSIAGPIPTSRLPKDRAAWPDPGHIASLNMRIF